MRGRHSWQLTLHGTRTRGREYGLRHRRYARPDRGSGMVTRRKRDQKIELEAASRREGERYTTRIRRRVGGEERRSAVR